MAQLFTIMPVNNVKAKSASQLYFSWWSARTIYSCIFIVLILLYNLLVFNWSFSDEIEFDKIGNAWVLLTSANFNLIDFRFAVPVIFYSSSSFARIFFIILAMKWPTLMMHWRSVEKKLPQYDSIREQSELAYKIKMNAIIIMTLSLSKATQIYKYMDRPMCSNLYKIMNNG